jgi:hypothetical protein
MTMIASAAIAAMMSVMVSMFGILLPGR